ncbi:MerR family transcriptional regulator [Streptomyces cupreus]|uniref:MerR family transcriptional regulator n=1 Tax=Streptomyces cupreus TaxID=2759956 RepID=A0A7X1JB21_9ACTN|nr:MerR family transcriptional regulator [Streptomyces cupreus]MBC2906949.1 MerR family transcriptional regulator [Streptomyces cupreus]
MRIGELADAVGVTTRTVRHYHHLGLLPEPERLSNGYRDYTLRHAVLLARIRRLTELGLGLGEVRDVLADDVGKELVEVLSELDDDLARQEAAIRERRARLRALMDSGVSVEGPVSPELASLFQRTAYLSSHSPMAAKDREILALIETSAGPEERGQLTSLLGKSLATPDSIERARAAYALLDDLADADPDDPRVDEASRILTDCLPDEIVQGAVVDHDSSFLRALYADFAPAQAEAIRRTIQQLVTPERTAPSPPPDPPA